MRAEVAEAAERQRQHAALEQQRLANEMELRRTELAKKRPSWMLAVTGTALVGIAIAGFVVVTKIRERNEANLRAQIANHDALIAKQHAKEAHDRVEKVEHDLDELKGKISAAIDAVADAQNDADRAKAKAQLDELQREQAKVRKVKEEAKAAAEKAERNRPITTSDECLRNPVCNQ